MYILFPELCKDILARQKLFFTERKRESGVRFLRDIREVIAKLKKQDRKVGRHRVRLLLPNPRMLYDQNYRDIFNQVMIEEGIH